MLKKSGIAERKMALLKNIRRAKVPFPALRAPAFACSSSSSLLSRFNKFSRGLYSKRKPFVNESIIPGNDSVRCLCDRSQGQHNSEKKEILENVGYNRTKNPPRDYLQEEKEKRPIYAWYVNIQKESWCDRMHYSRSGSRIRRAPAFRMFSNIRYCTNVEQIIPLKGIFGNGWWALNGQNILYFQQSRHSETSTFSQRESESGHPIHRHYRGLRARLKGLGS